MVAGTVVNGFAVDTNNELTLQKADAATEKKMAEWNADGDLLDVPTPARYTVFVYGNAGGTMDNIIEEGLWERLKPLLTDQTGVRVVCFYKYGQDLPEEDMPFQGKYADLGDIVWFELTSESKARSTYDCSCYQRDARSSLELCRFERDSIKG